jgi:hypothetical protein
MLTPWDMELEMLEDWLNHPEIVDNCHEKTVMQMLAEENYEESLRNFNQVAEQMIIAMPRHATEDEGKFQFKEHLEEVGDAPAGELAEEKLSKGEVEKRLSDKSAKLNFAAEWKAEATEKEDGMGDIVDLPICREKCSGVGCKRRAKPLEPVDEVIEEITRLMIRISIKACQ